LKARTARQQIGAWGSRFVIAHVSPSDLRGKARLMATEKQRSKNQKPTHLFFAIIFSILFCSTMNRVNAFATAALFSAKFVRKSGISSQEDGRFEI
jgi:hypothetical protein